VVRPQEDWVSLRATHPAGYGLALPPWIAAAALVAIAIVLVVTAVVLVVTQ
jgi:hypothetical protein